MILADGKEIPVDEYIETRYKSIRERVLPFLKELFERPEKKILIIGGRIAAIGAGIDPEEAKSAHIYYITQTPSGEIKISELNKRMFKNTK
ncbi:hypothetical protein KJA14_00920 [Patescibacteria group bacterium]|nr:hypothetical protein [Patescibacteria group bacterium]